MEKCYEKQMIQERHRHRYEFNNEYRETLIQHGLVMSGTYLRMTAWLKRLS